MATNGNNAVAGMGINNPSPLQSHQMQMPSPLQSHTMPIPAAGRPDKSPAAVDPAVAADDITSQIADTARMIRDIGRYAKEHGDYLQKLSDSFADRLQESAQNYAIDLLNSERRKLAELEKIMGRGTKRGDGA